MEAGGFAAGAASGVSKLLVCRPQAVLPVRPEEPCYAAEQRDSYDRVELMEILAEGSPVFSQLHTEVSQSETPGP
jgi:hypothetical protein